MRALLWNGFKIDKTIIPAIFVMIYTILCPKKNPIFICGKLVAAIHLVLDLNQGYSFFLIGIPRSRRKASLPFPLCVKGPAAWAKLYGCTEDQWVTKCQFPSHNCVYWITCPNGLFDLKGGICGTNHQLIRITCCNLSCPWSEDQSLRWSKCRKFTPPRNS